MIDNNSTANTNTIPVNTNTSTADRTPEPAVDSIPADTNINYQLAKTFCYSTIKSQQLLLEMLLALEVGGEDLKKYLLTVKFAPELAKAPKELTELVIHQCREDIKHINYIINILSGAVDFETE